MKPITRTCTLLAGLILCLAGSSQAGELTPSHVSADAKWIAHINVEAIQAIPHVQKWRERMVAKEKTKSKIEKIKQKTGVDPSEAVRGVTLYADRYKGKQGVALVYVKEFDRDKLNEWFMEKYPDHETTEHNNRSIYTWTAKHHGHEMTLSGTFANPEIVVVACELDSVKNALDIIDEKSKGLAADAALINRVTKNDLAFAHAMDVPAEYSKTTKCPVLRIVSEALGQWQFAENDINGHYELAVRSEESAQNIKTVIDGFKAMGALRYKDVEPVLKVVNSLTVNVRGTNVSIDFTESLEDLQAGVKAAIEYHKLREGKEKK